MAALRHLCAVLAALALTLGLPAFFCLDLGGDGTDAVSRASMEIPDKPSGAFVVLLNPAAHAKSADQWDDFFSEKPVDVIMDDVHCLVADADAAGVRLAERYQARLAENQMTLRKENGLLVTARAENGCYDVIVMSRELAEAFQISAPGARVITVIGSET